MGRVIASAVDTALGTVLALLVIGVAVWLLRGVRLTLPQGRDPLDLGPALETLARAHRDIGSPWLAHLDPGHYAPAPWSTWVEPASEDRAREEADERPRAERPHEVAHG